MQQKEKRHTLFNNDYCVICNIHVQLKIHKEVDKNIKMMDIRESLQIWSPPPPRWKWFSSNPHKWIMCVVDVNYVVWPFNYACEVLSTAFNWGADNLVNNNKVIRIRPCVCVSNNGMTKGPWYKFVIPLLSD